MSEHSTEALLKATHEHWTAAQSVNTGLFAFYGLHEHPEYGPGIALVLEWAARHLGCGNGPLDRAVRARLAESGMVPEMWECDPSEEAQRIVRAEGAGEAVGWR